MGGEKPTLDDDEEYAPCAWCEASGKGRIHRKIPIITSLRITKNRCKIAMAITPAVE